MNFKCKIFGALVYDENFAYSQDVQSGGWTYNLPFDIPSVAPATRYYVTVSAIDVDGSVMFSVDTDFTF